MAGRKKAVDLSSVDWKGLAAFVALNDVPSFLRLVQQHLQSSGLHYKAMQSGLCNQVLFATSDSAPQHLEFLVSCLSVLVMGDVGTGSSSTPDNAQTAEPGAQRTADQLDNAIDGYAARADAQQGQGLKAEDRQLPVPVAQTGAAAEAAPSATQTMPGRDNWSGTLSHLLLELLPPPASPLLTPEQLQQQRPRVLQLFTACYSSVQHARIALKVAQAFALTSSDLLDMPAVASAVELLLADRNGLTPGLGLVMHFPVLNDMIDRPVVLCRLVEEGKEAAAEKWLESLTRADQVRYVEICIAADRLKAAARATRTFGLQQEFPDIEARYRRSAVARLASKRVWAVAATFVGTDRSMQLELLQKMVEAEELSLADEYRKRFGLPPSALPLEPEALAAQEAARAARYLPLGLSPDRVLWVDGPMGLSRAREALAGAEIIGLDVEWKAGAPGEEQEGEGEGEEAEEGAEEAARGGGGRRGWGRRAGREAASPASLLQVATRDTAILFDLLALCRTTRPAAAAVPATGAPAAPATGQHQAAPLASSSAPCSSAIASDADPATGAAQDAGKSGCASAAAAGVADGEEGRGEGAAGGRGQAPGLDLDLDTVLQPLFGTGGALVLGFGLGGDLAKLASSYPHVRAFRAVARTLDLQDMWRALLTARAQAQRPKNAPPVQLSARTFQAGLSTLAQELLGKPLDKTMQISDWEARPLSARQVTYAALDAVVLVRLWDAFHQQLPPAVAQEVARTRTAPFRAGPSRPAAAAAAAGEGETAGEMALEEEQPSRPAAEGGEGPRWLPSPRSTPAVGAVSVVLATWEQQVRGGGACALQSERLRNEGYGAGGAAGLGDAGGRAGGGGESKVNGGNGAKGRGCAVQAPAMKQTSCGPAALSYVYGSRVSGGAPAAAAGANGAGGSTAGTPANPSEPEMGRSFTPAAAGAAAGAALAPTPCAGGEGLGGDAMEAVPETAAGGLPSRVHAVLQQHGMLDTAVLWVGGAPGEAYGRSAAVASRASATAASGDWRQGSATVAPHDTPSPPPLPLIGTAAEAAASLGVPAAAIAKSVAVLAAGKPWLAVVRGSRRLDWHKVAEAVGVGRRALRVATPHECLSAYGYAPGTLPPFGHPSPVPVLVDPGLRLAAQRVAAVTAGGADGIAAEADAGGATGGLGAEAATAGAEVDIETGEASAAAVAQGQPAAEGVQGHGTNAAQGNEGSRACNDAQEPVLYCGTGVPYAVVRLSYEQLLSLSNGRPADIVEAAVVQDDEDGDGGAAALAAGGRVATVGSAQGAEAEGVSEDGAAVEGGAGSGAPPCFLLDSMLGRLCRWLRCLGLDAEFVGRSSPGKTQLAKMAAAAAREGRIFLTRDSRLAERRDIAAPYVLHSDDPTQQLGELVRHFGVRFDGALVMSRCNACNAAAFELVQPREAARSLVPARVFEIVEEFWRCGSCGKVFWMGPKSASAIQLVGGMLARVRQDGEDAGHSFFNDGYPNTSTNGSAGAGTGGEDTGGS